MDLQKLVATGLTTAQAEVYAVLLKLGAATPPKVAAATGLTRPNAYKVLDRLVELRLAKKISSGKKFSYEPDNPLALSTLVAEQRNLATAREEAVKDVLGSLLASYHVHAEQPSINAVTGRDAVAQAYRQQILQLQPVYFIRSRADIPVMGFDKMHEIRVLPGRHDQNRFGITPDMTTGTVSPAQDVRSNLERTWVRLEDYDAPVEWSVSGSSLLIVLFGSEPHAVTIDNPIVANAFLQLWLLLDSCLRSMPYYNDLPRVTEQTEIK